MRLPCDICGDHPKLAEKDGGGEREAVLRADGSPKLWFGWKRWDEKNWCPKCWAGRFRTLAAAIPIVAVDADPDDKGAWKRFLTSLHDSFKAATLARNWTTNRLLRNDQPRTPEMTKQPPCPKVRAYHEVMAMYPGAPSSPIDSACNDAAKAYRKERREALWLGSRAVRTARYPSPWSVRASLVKIEDRDGALYVTLPLIGGKFTVRLSARRDFARQLRHWRDAAQGRIRHGDLKIYRVVERNGAAGGSGVGSQRRENGGGKRLRYKYMAALAVSVERDHSTAPVAGRIATLTSGDGKFLSLTIDGWDRPWVYRRRDLVRFVAEYINRKQSLSDDWQFEGRTARNRSNQFRDVYEAWATKAQRRIATMMDQSIAAVVKRAQMSRVDSVAIDLRDKSYLPSFGWYVFGAKLKDRLGAIGIKTATVDDPEKQEDDIEQEVTT